MAKKINLIPAEMAVPARAVKLSGLLSKLTTIGLIVLVASTFVLSGYYLYRNDQNNKMADNIATLKTQITNLEKNEQKLVLAKDRLEKIKAVKNIKSVNDEIKRFESVSSIVSQKNGLNMTEVSLKSNGNEMTVIASNTQTLAELLSPLSGLDNYDSIVISSLGYASGSGYVVNLAFKTE